jgi:hypothetical protein
MIWRILAFMLLAHAAWAQQISGGAGGGSSSSLVIGATTITGGATTQVLFNLGGVLSSDSGLTYAGSGGALTLSGAALGATAAFTINPASASGNLAVFQVNGTNEFTISAGGVIQPATRMISPDIRTSSNNSYMSTSGYSAKSTGTYQWTASADATAAPDTVLSRNAAGVAQIGTTAANALGSLLLTNITASGANVNFSGINATTETDMLCFNTSTGLVTHSTVAQQCTVSDVTKKRDIVPIDPHYALDVALGMDPIWFRYRPEADMGADIHAGFTMQRVASVEPRLATDTGVKYGELSPIWAGAIQALKNEIDDLRGKLR